MNIWKWLLAKSEHLADSQWGMWLRMGWEVATSLGRRVTHPARPLLGASSTKANELGEGSILGSLLGPQGLLCGLTFRVRCEIPWPQHKVECVGSNEVFAGALFAVWTHHPPISLFWELQFQETATLLGTKSMGRVGAVMEAGCGSCAPSQEGKGCLKGRI